MNFKGRDVISIGDFSKDEIIHILKTAKEMESNPKLFLVGKLMGTLFFEPSTRTRLSHEAAMEKLGGAVIGFADPAVTSKKKGETLQDTIKMVDQYVDVIVMRHNHDGAARAAAEVSKVPIINAGDGANQHPTQTLLDLYTIQKSQGKFDGLKIVMIGDLKYGRTVHSLAVALSHFKCEQYFVAPKSLKMPKYVITHLKDKNIKFYETEKMGGVLSKADIIYMTRIQEERFPDRAEYEKVKGVYILSKSKLKNVKKNMKILHPLPRVNEITQDVDNTPYAYYFEQAGNGIPTRQAILALILGAKK
ncbi:aspartate carbamoyltransferase [Candidatus Woesearchaeota archaeon]|nr:aspartate carbamoyltransferase [Candidatus Woesearchaeota archaeon]